MIDKLTESKLNSDILKETPPLKGRIEIMNNKSGEYGCYVGKTFIHEGKVKHEKLYLGKVINKDAGIFYSKKCGGFFKFSLENGFETDVNPGYQNTYPKYLVPDDYHITLEFGDVWAIEHIYRKSGLDKIMEKICPDSSDTLKMLVAFNLTNPHKDINYLTLWFQRSYAQILYPRALFDFSQIIDFHEIIGDEKNYLTFFKLYLKSIVQRDNDTDKTLAPILIDSALIPNNTIVPLQGINNQQSDDRDDLRLLYVMDKNSNLPIFIKHIIGNNFDSSSLLNTIRTLKTYHINVEDVVTDAAFSSTHNIKGLLKSNIPFITNMPNNREEYKELMGLYGTDLLKGKNAIVYNESKLCGIRVPIMINESQLYAYVMLDVDEMSESYGKAIERNINKPHSADKIDAELLDAAKFILLSSNKYEISEILPLYDTRRIIEGFYINLEKYKSLLPLGKYSDEMIRCILLIEFMTKVVQYLLDKDLKDSKYSSHSALSRLKCVWIRVYRSYEFNEATSQVEELTKEEKEIFSDLQLDLPFQTVETLKLPKKSSETTFTRPKKRGRPKGGTNKQV